MKCYCSETDATFTFCVEDVENAQLEDVIQHMGWRKTDGKFPMSFPQSVFSNQREKELVSSNFSRLGQTMFESLLAGNSIPSQKKLSFGVTPSLAVSTVKLSHNSIG